MEYKKTILISLGIMALILFSGCDTLTKGFTDCEQFEGTCEYYKCEAERSTITSHTTMYASQELVCLKREELKRTSNKIEKWK